LPPSETSRYARLATQLRATIEAGGYPSGELPPAGELAATYGVGLRTMQRALAELDRSGLTRSRQGRPRLVVSDAEADASTRYEIVADGVRKDIAAGALSPGGRLPSEAELVHQYDVSRTTIRQALAVLERSGEVVKRAGRRYIAGANTGSDLAYSRIAAELRRALMAGRYSVGRLPGENTLAEQHGVSRPTVRQALNQLQAEGLVYAAPKQGWFVSASAAVEGA
jgi:DNA-binding GntR family transcriptional regulator